MESYEVKLKCPVCGGGEFAEGHIIEDGFRPVQYKTKRSEEERLDGRLESRLCKSCGLVLSFLPVAEPPTFPDI